MILGDLIQLYNNTIAEIEQQWDELFFATSEGKAKDYPKDGNTYSLDLTLGENILSQIMKKYDRVDDMLFYIYSAKSKIKIPELGFSILCAEENLKILQQKLFYFQRLGQVVNEIGFTMLGVDNKNNIDIEYKEINKGFNISALDSSVTFLIEEIDKYEKAINSIIYSSQVIYPVSDIEEVKISSINNFKVQNGTPKTNTTQNEEVNLAEYANASDYVKNGNQINKKNIPERIISAKCFVCNSEHRDDIENTFNKTQGDMMQTLQFATFDCGLVTLTPNMLMNHIDNHIATIKTKNEFGNIEDTIRVHGRQGHLNLEPNAYNPDDHTPMDHAI